MQPSFEQGRWFRLALCGGALLAGAAFAGATAAGTVDSHAATRYRDDVRACQDGHTGQDRETCLKEVRNALAARQKGELETDTDVLQQNRTRRCQVHTGEARAACIARMSGRGAISGDVAAGGILREVETVVIPPDAGPVVIHPKTADPVMLVPDEH
jgi:hypothetical protein